MNATYSAIWAETGDVIYSRRPEGHLLAELPLGARPDLADPFSTLNRRDGGDPWEHATFVCQSGRRVVVTRDNAIVPAA